MYYLHSTESIFSVVTGESGLFLIINLYLFLYLPCFVEYAMLTGKPSITYFLPCLCEGTQASCSVGSSGLKY